MEASLAMVENLWLKQEKYATQLYEIGTRVTGMQHGFEKYRQGKAELICDLFEIPMEPFLKFSEEIKEREKSHD